MKIKEVMQKTGIPEKTIRYYESRGLIATTTERRNGRTYHEFSQENVEALEQIILLRRAQFSLEEIETLQRHPEQIQEVVRNHRLRMACIPPMPTAAENTNIQRRSVRLLSIRILSKSCFCSMRTQFMQPRYKAVMWAAMIAG